MKHILILIVLLAILVQPGFAYTHPIPFQITEDDAVVAPVMVDRLTVTTANPDSTQVMGIPEVQTGGMAGWPLPDKPIPHHEPGQPARIGNVVHQVTQLNTLGEDEVVALHGLDALLADGTITDPLQGNYRLVGLDKFMFSSYDLNDPNYSVESFEMEATAILDRVPNSNVDLGNLRFTEIAAGDLNGDYIDEQIIATASPTVTFRISQLPGSIGKTTSAPSVIAHPDGSLDVVVRGYDDALWHVHNNGTTWGNWDNAAGGLLLSAPAVVSRASGELDVFAVGTDNQVYHTHWVSPIWTTWTQVYGDVFTSTLGSGPVPDVPAPAVVTRGSGLDLFRLGPDNTLWWRHSADSYSWNIWENLGGMLASGPGAVSLGDGRMQVYALGLDGTLWYRTYNSNWNNWTRLEVPGEIALQAVPVVISPATGDATIYLAGAENRIWSIPYDGDWGEWTSTEAGDRSISGYMGQGLQLDGFDDYVDLPDGQPYEDDFTFTAWVYWEGGASHQRIFDFGQDSDCYMYLAANGSGLKPEFSISTGSWPEAKSLNATIPLTPNTWVHVAVTLDSGNKTGKLYINGTTLDTDNNIPLTPKDVVGQNTWLGKSQYANDPAFNGSLDEVAIFDRALNATEIADIYSSGWHDNDTGLLVGLHLEEVPAVHGTTLVDASGQGHDGTLHADALGGIGVASRSGDTHLLSQVSDGSVQYRLNDSSWERLAGLDVAQSFETGAVTAPLYSDDAVENRIFDITTGYFTGDGRQQIILTYEGADDKIRLEVYDIRDGLVLTKTAELAPPISGGWPRVAAGDVDGDGVDEIGLAFTPDSSHYQVKVYAIDKDSKGNWTGHLSYLNQSDEMAGKNVTDLTFAGTLRIDSGDVLSETNNIANDEFVLIADFQRNLRQWETQLYIYDHQDVVTSTQADWLQTAGSDWWSKVDVTGLGLAVGNVDGYGYEEIVATWPRAWYKDAWPDVYRDLVVWGYNAEGAWTELDRYTIPHQSGYTFLDTLVVGDLDQDLTDEILLAAYQHDLTTTPGYYLELYEYETFSTEGPLYRYPVSFGDVPRAFNLAMGDFTGESLRVGTPTYRLQNRVDSLVAVINMPPKHRDYVKVCDVGDSCEYELIEVMVDANTFAEHGTAEGDNSSLETKNQRDWAIGAGLDAKAEGFGASVDLSLQYSYGENFEGSEASINTRTFSQKMKADGHDMIAHFGTPYQIWEYPLYAPGTPEPIDYVSVIWPVPDYLSGIPTTPDVDTRTADYPAEPWYRAGHQTYNVWSYEPIVATPGFPDFDSQQIIMDSNHDGGSWEFAFSEGNTTVLVTDTTKTHDFSSELGVGMKGGFLGGLIKYNVRAHVNGSYKQADIQTEEQTTSEQTDISGALGLQSGFQFTTKAIGYRAKGGYLVLDYQTDIPSAGWDAYYADPDPAFILPWAGFKYGNYPVPPTTGLELFSPEVQVVPESASVGETVTISATVRNFSNFTAYSVTVRFCQGDPGPSCEPPDGPAYIGKVTIPELARPDGPQIVTANWQATGVGKQKIYAVIDPDNDIAEVHDEDDLINNNIAYGFIKIGGAAIVDHGQAAELPYQSFSYNQGNAWTISAYVPPGNLSEVIDFGLQDAGLSLSNVVGKPFELVAYAGKAFSQNPDDEFPLKPTASDPPAVIALAQSDADVANLMLYRATNTSGSSWEVATCTDYQIQRFPDENLIYVPVCETGIFVFAESSPEPTLAPVAQFSAAVTSGPVPLTVAFTDRSSHFPTSWLWTFGDGSSSGEQHPTYVYTATGTYTVSLTASNPTGSHTDTRPNYITVTKNAINEIMVFLPLVLRRTP